MRMEIGRTGCYRVLVFSISLAASVSGIAQSAAGHPIVEWYAVLTAARYSSQQPARVVNTEGAGRVSLVFDYKLQNVAFDVQTSAIKGLRRIDLHSMRFRGDLSGPLLYSIFDARADSAPRSIHQVATSADFHQIMSAIDNGQAVIVVTTAEHHEGELAGIVGMHKRYAQ